MIVTVVVMVPLMSAAWALLVHTKRATRNEANHVSVLRRVISVSPFTGDF